EEWGLSDGTGLTQALGVMGGLAMGRFCLALATVGMGYLPHGALAACLLGLGPNWEDIEAKESDLVAEIAELLKECGELRSDEIERWYADGVGRVVYCRYKEETWNSYLFEFRDGKWSQVNSVRTVL
ncbi:MAG: hypothetical protein U1F26_07065, partial [Lysobacterales bacterium]